MPRGDPPLLCVAEAPLRCRAIPGKILWDFGLRTLPLVHPAWDGWRRCACDDAFDLHFSLPLRQPDLFARERAAGK
jgi:hypothetical protein